MTRICKAITLAGDYFVFFCINCWAWIFINNTMWAYYRSSLNTERAFLRVARPVTAVDKFLFRKLFDHAPYYKVLCDKLLCKEWIKKNFPELKTAAVLWQGKSIEDLPKELIGGSFVLKSNHASGHVIDLSATDLTFERIKAEAKDWLKHKHWKKRYEWGYSNIEPEYFVEEKIVSGDRALLEFKAMTFGSRMPLLRYLFGLPNQRYRTVFVEKKPGQYKRDDFLMYTPDMAFDPWETATKDQLKIAQRIGSMFDHVRVDFFLSDGQAYFSELTFYASAGRFDRLSYTKNNILTDAWDIRESWFFQTRQNFFMERYKAAYLRWTERMGQPPAAKVDYSFIEQL